MADDEHDAGAVPVTVRVPRDLYDWLKSEQAQHAKVGLRISVPTLINQQIALGKTTTTARTSGPKKARAT